MVIRVGIENIDEVKAAFSGLDEEFEAAATKAVQETTFAIHADVVRGIQRGSKTGRIYTRRGVTHQASAPGQPPATDTGRLVGSVQKDIKRGFVWSKLAYAQFLEFGTRRMSPRPIWVPTAKKQGIKFRDRLLKYLNEASK